MISTVFLSSYRNVFIPNYITELKQQGNIRSFQASSFLITISLGLFIILITYLFSNVYLETFFKGHTNSYYSLIKLQLYYVLPCLVFFKEKVLAIGMLIGSFLDFLFLLIVSLKRKIIHIGKPGFYNKNIRILLKQVPSKVSSALINGLNPIVDQYFSAQLIVGSIAALNYGIKIPVFIIGLIGIALENLLLPYFSSQVVENYKKPISYYKKHYDILS